MNKKDDKEFALLMAALAQNFESECPTTKVKLYSSFLSDLEIGQLKVAIDKIINESIYPKFPTIGAIRQAAFGSTDEQAILAWRKVFRAVQCVGQYRSIQFDEPVIHSVIELMGGWENLCIMQQKDVQWREKEFINVYKSLRGKRLRHAEYLPGICELQNMQKGYPEAIEETTQWPATTELEDGKAESPKLLREATVK